MNSPHLARMHAMRAGEVAKRWTACCQVVRPSAMSSTYQPGRRVDQSQQPIYASSTATTTTMYAPVAERAIPYEQYVSRDAEHIYSATRVTPRNTAATPSRTSVATTDDGGGGAELRQFSREPAAISVTSTAADGDATAGSRSSDKGRPAAAAANGIAAAPGFDSNTLKRMLQTLPELSSPVDLMQEFEDEFADVVGPSTTGDVKPVGAPPPLPPPLPADDDDDDDRTRRTTGVRLGAHRAVDASPASSVADVTASPPEVATSDVSNERTEAAAQSDVVDSGNGEPIAPSAVQRADVPPPASVTLLGQFHLPLLVLFW